MSDPNIYNKVG